MGNNNHKSLLATKKRKKHKLSRLKFLALFALLCGGTARAQNPVTWSIKTDKRSALQAGEKFNAQVVAQIQRGWHIYSITQGPGGPIPTRITVPEGQPFKLIGAFSGRRPRVAMDPNFEINTETYETSVTFNLSIVVASDAPASTAALNVNVRYQACDDKLCLPPRTVKLILPVTFTTAEVAADAVRSAAMRRENEKPSPPPNTVNTLAKANPAGTKESASVGPGQIASDSNGPPTNTVETTTAISLVGPSPNQSLWSFIWLAMTVGALSLLTPCVFPMVPITVSYFTNHARGDRVGAIRDASIYALGIILTFTALGIALAALFGAAGINRFAASPWVNLAITAIFISFAMSLFGAYSLQVPAKLLTKLDRISRSKESNQVVGLLLMGLTFSLTSFTCTAPFVGTLLVMAAQGRWVYPVIGMLAFSTVFALPFFALALAPQLLSQLPKSGGWLNSVKVVMGLLEIAAAMKFLSNVDLVWHWSIFTRAVVLASWVAVALLIAFYLLGKFQLAHDSPGERIGGVRLLLALISLAFSFYLLTGLFGRPLGELESFLPPETAQPSSAALLVAPTIAANGELPWITNDYDAALRQAKTEQKPVFIDFTGYTCTNCRWMEVNMFTKAPVKEELAKYVRVRLYTDGEGQPYEAFQQMQQEKFGTVALPLYAVVNADGNSLTTFAGLTRDQGEFVSFLKAGQMKFGAVLASPNYSSNTMLERNFRAKREALPGF